jgi:hypothetical protein
MADVPEGLARLVRRLFPGSTVVRVDLLAPDSARDDTEKAQGFGVPLRVAVRAEDGAARVLTFHTASANAFGHDRRSDRAAGILLSYDTFPLVPDHVRALDVGAILPGGELLSLRESGEFYLLTSFAEGRTYAEDLRRVTATGVATPGDLERCEALARWLARLHREPLAGADGYRRAVRDLLGHGEGIFGMVDGYGPDVPSAPPARLQEIERRCLEWRWRLRGREGRLRRTHGDFHPFNIVFEEGGGPRFTALDASRGCQGDPADDLTALAVNYVLFAADAPRAWARGLGPLWRRFWATYLDGTGDREVLEVAPPWLAWRCIVVASPAFYPHLPAPARDTVLSLAERSLAAGRLDVAWAEELFP